MSGQRRSVCYDAVIARQIAFGDSRFRKRYMYMPKVTKAQITEVEQHFAELADEKRMAAWRANLWCDLVSPASKQVDAPRVLRSDIATVLDHLIIPHSALFFLSIERLPWRWFGVSIVASKRAEDLYDSAGPTLEKARKKGRALLSHKEKAAHPAPSGYLYRGMIESLHDLPALLDAMRLQEQACFRAQEALRSNLSADALHSAIQWAEMAIEVIGPDPELTGLIERLKEQEAAAEPHLGSQLMDAIAHIVRSGQSLPNMGDVEVRFPFRDM